MRSAAALAVLLLATLAAAAPAAAQQRARFDTRVLAQVPRPGYPAHAYVHPDGRIYAGTYVNPGGDTMRSKVFEYSGEGTLLRSWTVPGQSLGSPHGVQVATSDARGRLLVLDKTPARALLLDRASGDFTPYATFADLPGGGPPTPNYAAWGPDGSLYVTDYLQGVIWRVPPRGGEARVWLADGRLDGGEFGTTGLELAADRRTLLIGQQVVGGELITGGLLSVAIGDDGRPGALRRVWTSGPLDLADGIAIAKSGRLYVALVGPSQLAVLSPEGRELERFPRAPLTGATGSHIPFDGLSSVAFSGTRLITASQSFLFGNPDTWALHDVEAGEPGIAELIPANAGPPPPAAKRRAAKKPRRCAKRRPARNRPARCRR